MSHTKDIGTGHYYLDDLYSPDTAMKQAEVLHLGPMISKVPGYWFDQSRYQNHAAINGTIWVQMPNGLWVMSLDGVDDNHNLGLKAIWDLLAGDFVLWAVLNINTSQNGAIFSNYAGSGVGWSFILNAATSQITYSIGSSDLIVAYTFPANTYQMYSVSRIGADTKFYVNKTQIGATQVSVTTIASTLALRFGIHGNGISVPLKGIVSECGIIKGAGYTDAQITQHYLSARERLTWANLP